MRFVTSTLPLLLSSVVVLGHLHAHAHPARHAELADRVEKRQQETGSRGGLLGGLIGDDDDDDTASNSTSVTPPITQTPTGTAPITTTSAVRPIITTSSSTVGPSSSTSTLSPSTPLVSSTNSTTAEVSASESESSVSASITSAEVSSSAEPSTAPGSQAVTTVTTDPGGEVKVITKIMTASVAANSDGAAASSAAPKKDDGGISTGAIIGISVAAGVLILTLIGCAIWRMKRRGGDEDDAIRWPELNRHGDSDVHHALPARQTGQHGFETGLERSLSNSSSVFTPSTHNGPHSAAPMALNGSNFGAGSSVEGYEYDEKAVPALPPLPGQHVAPHLPYDDEDYANMPPAVQMQQAPSVHAYGGYDSEEEGRPPMPHEHAGAGHMTMAHGGAPATYYSHGH